jgi:hypothetical protein
MPFSCAVYLTLQSLLLPPHLNGAIKLISARVSSRSMRRHRVQKSGENVNGRFGPADALRHSGRSPQSVPVKPVDVRRRAAHPAFSTRMGEDGTVLCPCAPDTKYLRKVLALQR